MFDTLEQVGVSGKGQPCLVEGTASGVSYEPVGTVEGLADDAMQHGVMKDLATVSVQILAVSFFFFCSRLIRVFFFFTRVCSRCSRKTARMFFFHARMRGTVRYGVSANVEKILA